MSSFDPKEKLRKMASKHWGHVVGIAQEEEDPKVLKYAERIKVAFQGIDDELALRMAKETFANHVRG
jgi:hypothetical protein